MKRFLLIFPLILSVTSFVCLSVNAADFDIPIEELKKVKKKPAKSEHSKRDYKKRKKTAKNSDEPKVEVTKKEEAATVAAKDETNSLANLDNGGAVQLSTPKPAETVIDEKKADIKNVQKSEKSNSIFISHTPYNFIIPEHRTVIKAILSASSDIKIAELEFYADDNPSESAILKFEKLADSKFTYKATIPAVAKEAQKLSYKIKVVAENGENFETQTFSTAISSENIIPGWQLQGFEDKLEITVPTQELKFFADPAIKK